MTDVNLPTVVIVNYRTTSLTVSFARSLVARYPQLPVVVVDNSDRDIDWDGLRAGLPRETRRVRSESNIGFGAAVNAAVPHVATSHVLLLNPDLGSIPTIERLMQTAEESGATIVGGLTVDDRSLDGSGGFGGAPSWRTFVRYALPVRATTTSLMGRVTESSRWYDVGWVSGACLLLDARAAREMPFDESLFLYAEDIDLCWRHLTAGRRVVLEPRVQLRHQAGGSSGGRPPLRWACNLALVMQRWVPRARTFLVVGLVERGVVALVTRRTDHGRFLLRSARAAAFGSGRPLVSNAAKPSGRQHRSMTHAKALVKGTLFKFLPMMPAAEFVDAAAHRRDLRRLEDQEDQEVVRSLAALSGPVNARVVTVIATYRRPDLLLRAVDSALGQDVDGHAVVVVDDGGGQVPAFDDPRVTVIHLSRNIGVCGVVRNVGIRCSRSQYLAFLDDDNSWTREHLTSALALIGNSGFTHSGVTIVDADGRQRATVNTPITPRLLRHGNVVDASSIVAVRSPAVMFSRLPRRRGGARHEDWEFARRVARKEGAVHVPAETVVYLDNPDSYYRQGTGPGGASEDDRT